MDRFWTLGVRKAGGFRGIRGGAECMRTHVADGDGLTSSSGRGRGRGTLHLARTDATGKASADLLGRLQFSPRERSGPGDERSGTVVLRRLGLE